jgi:excisionase family DNA binding protein
MTTLSQILPTAEDRELANEASRILSPHLGSKSSRVQIILPPEDGLPQETAILPRQAFELLQRLLTEMACGNAVSLVPQHAELTTNQAADVLGVSRPYLVKELLKKGIIPFRKIGTHRRVAFADLMAYQEARSVQQEAAMQALADIAQENDMGY